MYERILPLIPEEVTIRFSKKPGEGGIEIHLPNKEAVLASFEEDWINSRYAEYYKAVKNLGSESGIHEIGEIIVKNLGGNIDDPEQTLKASMSFVTSLKHINNYLDNFEIE